MKNPKDAEEYVNITLNIFRDSVSVHSVEPVPSGRSNVDEYPELMLKRRLEYSSMVSGPSSPIHQDPAIENTVEENPEPAVQKRNASQALKGLKMFISMTDAGWNAVDKRFDQITAETGGMLIRSKFGECVGINSREFALELFDTLARRFNVTREVVNKAELWDFFEQVNDKSVDSRLKIFFEMADKDGDGRLTEEEVREFVWVIASANNQSTTQKMIDEHAALIMEYFDIYDMGYIIEEVLELLLPDVETLSETTCTEESKKPAKRWYKIIKDISSSSLIPRLKKRASLKKT